MGTVAGGGWARDSWRDLWRWDVLLGGLGVGLGIAAVGQAIRGNHADEVVFTAYAAGLLPVGLWLLWRAAHSAGRWTVSFVTSYAAIAGLQGGAGLPLWVAWPAGFLVWALADHLCGRVGRHGAGSGSREPTTAAGVRAEGDPDAGDAAPADHTARQ